MFSTKFVAIVAALLAQEAAALNAHRHGHSHFHAKKDVVYVNDVVTVTDWTIVTVYEDGSPVETTGPKTFYKGSPHSEHYASASSSASSSIVSSSSLSSSTSSSSTSTSTSTSIYVAPTTLVTTTKTSSTQTPTTTTTSVADTPAAVQANAQAETAAAESATTEATTPLTTTTLAAAVFATTPTTTAAATTTTAASSSSGKNNRGLAYNSGSLLSPFLNSGTKCSWSYNWGQTADSSAPSDIEFVPMLWGPTHASTWSSNAAKAIANGATNFLSFNECDNAGQCNLDASSAAAAHIEYMNPYSSSVRISTPAITNSNLAGEGIDWLSAFLSACNGNCAYDFCAAHWYNNADVDEFLSHMTNVYNVCGKPVWVTEFAPFGSDEEINTFLETLLDKLDNDSQYDFIERFSYFMVATGSLLTSSTSLSLYGNTYAYN